MPLLGAHMSIGGGLDRALVRAREIGCQAIQIFTGNTSQWDTKPLSLVDIEAFQKARAETSIQPVAVHDRYLINLASSSVEIRKKSFSALLEELQRTEALEIPYLVMHPGSHTGDGEKIGIRRISRDLSKIHALTPGFKAKILLETTAGQGTSLGCRFEHLAEIKECTDAGERLGICLDTCHIFAAGYDFRTAKDYRGLIQQFDDIIGLDSLKLLHINDSKKDLGSRVDRHEHLGLGFIGKKAFSFFLKDPSFRNTPFLLETPKGRNERGVDQDVLNLRLLRRLMKE